MLWDGLTTLKQPATAAAAAAAAAAADQGAVGHLMDGLRNPAYQAKTAWFL
jgi:hypothetical protein